VYKVPFPAAYLPEIAVCVLDDSHTGWSEMESQYIFDLHVPES
jgi:hypothetical protein